MLLILAHVQVKQYATLHFVKKKIRHKHLESILIYKAKKSTLKIKSKKYAHARRQCKLCASDNIEQVFVKIMFKRLYNYI